MHSVLSCPGAEMASKADSDTEFLYSVSQFLMVKIAKISCKDLCFKTLETWRKYPTMLPSYHRSRYSSQAQLA